MIRINSAIPVKCLTDEHLLAEHREIKQITTIQKNNDNETIKCSLFDDITECNFNHPCDDCSRLIRHEEL